MALISSKLKYLDLLNYLAAGTSLKKFYAAYKVSSPKGLFPYQWFDSLDKLKYDHLPERDPELRKAMDEDDQETIAKLVENDPFYSILKRETISNKDLDECHEEWRRLDMKTFADYVKYYNNLDVIGMIEAVGKMNAIYHQQGFSMFKDAISLPKLTQKIIFKPLKKDYFVRFGKPHKHLFKDLRANLTGGPSIIFTRHHEKGKTRIRNGPAICQAVDGFDCNAMYLWATGLPQCTGPYCYRRKDENYKKHSKRKEKGDYIRYSQMAINWLDWIQKTRRIAIRHAENNCNGEMRIENMYVDGFCKETNTVFEFFGCFHHGHQCNPKHRLEEWIKTQDRIKRLQELGYKVESITQCEWKRDGIPTPEPVVCTQQDIQDTIMRDEVFGIVKVSLYVPDHLKSYFEDFPPLFKNQKIEFNDIGEHMQEYCRSITRRTGVKRSLISSMKGKEVIIYTYRYLRQMLPGHLIPSELEINIKKLLIRIKRLIKMATW